MNQKIMEWPLQTSNMFLLIMFLADYNPQQKGYNQPKNIMSLAQPDILLGILPLIMLFLNRKTCNLPKRPIAGGILL